MRGSVQLIPIFVTVIIAIAVPLSLVTDDQPASIDELQKLATAACKCEHYGSLPDTQDCWAAYRAATAGYEVSSTGSACYPISSEVDFLSRGQTEIGAVLKGFRVVDLPGDVDPYICTGNDADAVASAGEEAFQRAGGSNAKDPDSAQAAQNRAFVGALKSIQGGKPIVPAVTGGGC